MQCVATLIADPVRADLSAHHVEAVSGALAASGAEITATDWLDQGTACDLAFTGPAPATARQAVSDAIAAPSFDIAVQPRTLRRWRYTTNRDKPRHDLCNTFSVHQIAISTSRVRGCAQGTFWVAWATVCNAFGVKAA